MSALDDLEDVLGYCNDFLPPAPGKFDKRKDFRNRCRHAKQYAEYLRHGHKRASKQQDDRVSQQGNEGAD